MRIIYLNWHLGLGDCVLCNGLLRVFARRYNEVIIPCYEKNIKAVEGMFSDLKNVSYVIVGSSGNVMVAATFEHFKIGDAGERFRDFGDSFDQAFYRQAGIPFEERWNSFHIPNLDPAPKSNGYAFIHDDASRGFRIRTEEISEDRIQFHQPVSLDMLCDTIQHASEVHVINSAMLHLAESIPTAGKLYYHRYVRDESPFDRPVLKKGWTIID